ncbi:hypothetical protein SARC_05134 [Sphaeroforma arctica JP610]|uniref:Phosphoglycerate mutase n=1 Tax=Sphaeroforma arctica JP610 TaxID=667725 RepID=A0A0L0G348_9EUKA|nr:hypothetical protein SARC_05134 [Sphaeroforma arctica JP610]KNC82583.1 hypothetical protein SARC_05134 [Sphaeroforma arctica JP610]|eukprot:XP_014156485.1 hypothetical protein SARC_05134 [Sphaeroforma arctica JP610]
MVFSKDRSYKQPIDSSVIADSGDLQYKTLVFIRHGESDWNEVFNRALQRNQVFNFVSGSFGFGEYSFPISNQMCRFWTLLFGSFSEGTDSRDHDAHDSGLFVLRLTTETIAEEGRKLVNGDLDGPSHKSVLVCSNLRRAIATATLGLRDRIQRTGEKIHMLSCLQEISRNVDTIALALPHKPLIGRPARPDVMWNGTGGYGICITDSWVPDMHGLGDFLWKGYSPETCYDVTSNFGTKVPDASNGLMRMNEFAEWCFERSEDTVIVAGGHSLYGREFFKAFLPRGRVAISVVSTYLPKKNALSAQKRQLS